MKIVVDANIPAAGALFGQFGDVVALPGRKITRDTVLDATAVIVRSVTIVDSNLLSDSQVRFVGSATAGIDHVDQEYLDRAGITFSFAPGSNADSVVDYVVASLLELSTITDSTRAATIQTGKTLAGRTLGIVGHGAVGGRLERRAAGLGLEVLLNDPPKVAANPGLAEDPRFVNLDRLLSESDIVSVHVPLDRRGPYPTWHLIDATGLARLRDGAWLVNTSRGPVVDNNALTATLQSRNGIRCVLDVWELEPDPPPALIRLVDFGSPHIAGYAHDGKIGGAAAVAHDLAKFLGRPEQEADFELPRQLRIGSGHCTTARTTEWCLCAVARQLYPFVEDFRRFREIADIGGSDERRAEFERLRTEYPKRRAFSSFDVAVSSDTSDAVRAALHDVLGVRVLRQAPGDHVS